MPRMANRCRKEIIRDHGGISIGASSSGVAQAKARRVDMSDIPKRSFPSLRHGKGVALKAGCATPLTGWTGGQEIGAKARLSGFGPIVELAAGGRGAEARKGIAPDPGDRNAKSVPFAARVEQPPNRKVRAISSESVRSDRGEATGGRQQCRPPFRSGRPRFSPCRAANRELLRFGAHVP